MGSDEPSGQGGGCGNTLEMNKQMLMHAGREREGAERDVGVRGEAAERGEQLVVICSRVFDPYHQRC